jgi:hypothetical protein
MANYVWHKAKGRIAIFVDGEFDHQQFRGHWGYARPDEYLEHCKRLDREAAVIRAEERAARLDVARAYLAKRAARACHCQLGLFA